MFSVVGASANVGLVMAASMLDPALMGRVLDHMVQVDSRELFPDIGIIDHKHGIADSLKRPTIGVLASDVEHWMMVAHGHRAYPQARWLLIPHVPQNLFIQGGMVFVHGAVSFECDSTLRLSAKKMVFPEPIMVDRLFTMQPLPSQIEESLISHGYPVTNSSLVRQFINNKVKNHRFFERAHIRSPRYEVISKGDGQSLESLELLIRQIIERHGFSSFVIKPTTGKGGAGVGMFEKDDISQASVHAYELLSQWDGILIEERIKSYPLVFGKKRKDWNIRVVIPPGDLKEWDLLDTTEARYNDFNGQPVNKRLGAKIAELQTVFDHMGLSQHGRKKIVEELYRIANVIRELLHEELVEEAGDERLGHSECSYFSSPLLGIDVIIDEDLNIYLIEINAGAVGGMGSLAEIREGDARFRAVHVLTRNLFSEAQGIQMTGALSRVGKTSVDRMYVEDSDAWLGLCIILSDAKDFGSALYASERAIEIYPNNEKAWLGKGAALANLGKYEEALRAFENVIKINPKNEKAWINKGAVLGILQEYEGALGAYDRAIEINPNSAEARLGKLASACLGGQMGL